MAASPDLFGFVKPRAPKRVMAHIADAGDGIGFFICKCGWESGWVECPTVTYGKRGIPCPQCNQTEIER